MSKRVLLAAPRGYCAGVDRAVVAVEKSLELYGAPVYVRKEIVHNKHVVSTLEQRGVIFVNETDEVPEGATVVFSAHGVSPAVHAEAAARNLKTIDATCPLVTKVHNEVKRFANEETEILLIGHNGHEEVEGTAGEAPGKVRVVDGLDEARTIQPTPGKKLVWLTQTTLSVDETMQSVAILKDRFPEIANPPSDDICYATQNRQEAIKAIAPEADLVLVVGSTNSSNSVRLVEVALEEVKEEWLTDAETIGVTSGASVPEILVNDLLKHLDVHGYHNVEEVRATEETLLFALPKELRADLKAAK
jgi:4-hydroxy-3-methylbut-2-enyl diphosphate reductase